MKDFLTKYIIEILIGILVLSGLIYLVTRKSDSTPEPSVPNSPNTPSPSGVEKLAKCLKDKGAKFYGTSTCPHCNSQKQMFGDAAKFLPYIECSGSAKACVDAGVNAYPTWVFSDGTKYSGELTPELLEAKVNC